MLPLAFLDGNELDLKCLPQPDIPPTVNRAPSRINDAGSATRMPPQDGSEVDVPWMPMDFKAILAVGKCQDLLG